MKAKPRVPARCGRAPRYFGCHRVGCDRISLQRASLRRKSRPTALVSGECRLEVVVDAPPTPPTEPSAGVERWIGSIKLYRLWLKRRSSCLSPSLGAYGLQDAPPRSGQPNTTS